MADLHDDTLELLDRLIAFDTTSRNSNLALIDFAEAHLSRLGARCERVLSEGGDKANLLATLGPDVEGGIMLSGHTDVVPVDGQDWHGDPFRLSDAGERLYGRGTADMKGFIAVALAVAEQAAAGSLARPLHLALSYDEEIGCRGVQRLIDVLQHRHFRPAFGVIGEPTSMQIGIGHKGSCAYHARFRGRAAHSSLAPLAVNAVEHAAEFVTRLTALGRRFAHEGPFDADYDVGHTTVHTGMFHGGTQLNIVPANCEVEFEFRPLPEQAPEAVEQAFREWIETDIEPGMRAVDPGCGVELTRRYAYPGLRTEPEEACVQVVGELLGTRETVKVAFGTEAGSFRERLGIPAVVCGPGSIRQAHQPDEYVSHEQLRQCERFLQGLVATLNEPKLPRRH